MFISREYFLILLICYYFASKFLQQYYLGTQLLAYVNMSHQL